MQWHKQLGSIDESNPLFKLLPIYGNLDTLSYLNSKRENIRVSAAKSLHLTGLGKLMNLDPAQLLLHCFDFVD